MLWSYNLGHLTNCTLFIKHNSDRLVFMWCKLVSVHVQPTLTCVRMKRWRILMNYGSLLVSVQVHWNLCKLLCCTYILNNAFITIDYITIYSMYTMYTCASDNFLGALSKSPSKRDSTNWNIGKRKRQKPSMQKSLAYTSAKLSKVSPEQSPMLQDHSYILPQSAQSSSYHVNQRRAKG